MNKHFTARGLLAIALTMGAGLAQADGGAPVQVRDETGNYAGQTQWLGGTGGAGWEGQAWRAISADEDNIETSLTENDMSLETATGAGEAVVGRDLPAPLASGSFTANAWLDAGGDFVGFAVSENGGELFRFGVWYDAANRKEGYWYFTPEERDGVMFYEGTLSTTVESGVEYELTWRLLEQGLEFTMAENTHCWEAEALVPLTVTVEGASSVDAIAMIACGDKRLSFSSVEVSGTPAQTVPEPGTLALGAIGAAVLAVWRRRRG